MSETSTDVAQRIEQILADMTLAEKAGQLTQYFYFGAVVSDAEEALAGAGDAPADLEIAGNSDIANQPRAVEDALARGEVGSLLFVTDPAETNRLQRLAIEGNRHGIGVLFGFDVIHGLRTIFPVPIAVAASWDPAVAEAGQAIAAKEARAVGIHWAFAPMVDIARDPRWGRIIEGAGEDPALGAAIAAGAVRGFQGEHLGASEHIMAGPKHFAGYGYGLGGRDYDEVNLSDSEFYNVVLPPFRAAIEAGAGNIMTAYMGLNGVPATGNRWLLHDVLRGELGFDGFIVSDANAAHDLVTHGFAADLTDAAAKAVGVGMDMEMCIADPAFAHIEEAVAAGALSEADVDACVRRVLTAKAAFGLLDANPYVDEAAAQQVLDDPAHREAARVAAEQTAVLLKNDQVGENALLPLSTRGSVAVIGPLADSRRDTIGPWVFDPDVTETVTILQGITDHVGADGEVTYAPGTRPAFRMIPSMFDMWPGNTPVDPENFDDEAELARAVATAAAADVAVVVLGEWQNMIGENASRSSLELPGRQLELLQKVAETGTPVVLVVMNGRPLDLRWADEHVPAILDVWYPGTSGGTAVANLLFGDAVPSGKLPFSWPRTVGQVPMIYSHLTSHEPQNIGRRYWDEESTPLYPFGHGLSYTSFEFRDLTVGADAVEVTVANTGDRDGAEVVQLYVHQRAGRAARPVRELKGFRKVTVAAGAGERVRFPLGADQIRYWNAVERDWVVDPGTFDVWVGSSSTAELHGEFSWE